MALVKCKECGSDVSTKASACPKCGAKVKRRGIGVMGWLGILVLVGVGAAAIAPQGGTGAVGTSSSTAPPRSPKEEALAAIEIKKLNWQKGGFDSVMLVDATIQNNGKRDVKDIELTCTHYSNSNTRIDSNRKTVFEIFAVGKPKVIKNFSMGFIHSQAASTSCEITSLTLL